MSDVLIRDVPPEDLDLLKVAASQAGASLQRYLHDTLQERVVWLRRQAALTRREETLRGRPVLGEDDRAVLLDAMDYDQPHHPFDQQPTGTDDSATPR